MPRTGKNIFIKHLEAELQKANQVIENQQKHNEAMQTTLRKSCTLHDVSASGRVLTLHFQHNDKTFEIAMFAEMGVTVEAIKKQAGLM